METIVLHHNDADGFGAAFAFWMLYGLGAPEDPVTYIPVQYGQPVPELPPDARLFILDFSYSREICEDLASKHTITIIDHHKTAKAALDGLSYARFSEDKSGAVAAWEYFHNTPVPDILLYVQDRDLWKFELPCSEEVNLFIATLPEKFAAWEGFDLEMAIQAGKAIRAFRDAQTTRAMRNTRVVEFGPFTIPTLNLTENVSEVGNLLCKAFPEHPFSLSYCRRGDGKWSYSLRSIGEFDVSEIARKYGGGGHRNAAGFALEVLLPALEKTP